MIVLCINQVSCFKKGQTTTQFLRLSRFRVDHLFILVRLELVCKKRENEAAFKRVLLLHGAEMVLLAQELLGLFRTRIILENVATRIADKTL